MPAALTDPEWTAWEGVLARKSAAQIAEDLGKTPSYATTLLAQLRNKGVIRRVGDLPPKSRYRFGYPWERVSDQPPLYKPALPPHAQLHLDYVPTSQRDRTVRPIRFVEWQCWTAQGVPILRRDGKHPKEALTEECALVLSAYDLARVELVNLYQRWHESQTVDIFGQGVTPGGVQPITLVIACAIGGEGVLDITTTRETESDRSS